MSPFISVVIPVYNDSERLALCLEAIEDQSYPKAQYEVLVVDNASSEDVASVVARFSQARLLYEERKGSYAARNRGIEEARGDIIAFTDSDCIPDTTWLEKGAEYLTDHSSCAVLGGRIDFFYQTPDKPNPVEAYDSARFLNQKEYVEQQNYAATANLFTWRWVFAEVGAFDAALQSGGDTEWGQRVTRCGHQLCYAEEARVKHPARHSYRELRKKTTRIVEGTVRSKLQDGYPVGTMLLHTLRDVGHHVKYALKVVGSGRRFSKRHKVAVLVVFPLQGVIVAVKRVVSWLGYSG